MRETLGIVDKAYILSSGKILQRVPLMKSQTTQSLANIILRG